VREWELLLQAAEQGETVQTVTLISGPPQQSAKLGQMLLLFSDGRVEGALLDAVFTEKVANELKFGQWTQPSVRTVRHQQEEYRLFWDCTGSDSFRAVILGGGHVSQPLAQVLALLDYQVTVVDDRPEFANSQRFPQAEVVCQDFPRALPGLTLDEKTAVIIVTRGHRHDMDCLRGVLSRPTGYVGMIGSSVKVGAALKLLQEEGVDQRILAKLRAPIGLDIGAQGPAEIALSIAAEVVSVFRGGDCAPLCLRRKDIHG
jgi:xanthine dehydrogenase accessory factor